MLWISNNDPPLYVWKGDLWYNQKDKITYYADVIERVWIFEDLTKIDFPKRTKIMKI